MSATLSDALREQARVLGFELVGIAPATEADGFAHLEAWLDKGYAGEMSYLERHREARRHPRALLPEVRRVIMLGMSYANAPTPPSLANQGRVARYAQGPDYHEVIRERLNQLLDWLMLREPTCIGRGVVDTAPLLERDFARRAGLGWIGKNTLLIHPKRGSYLFLAALLVNLELPINEPFAPMHCGTCTRCLTACPTQAFPEPGVLDARRCISYLTIELRSAIPVELRESVGDWWFGCDVCQEVCPWNRRATPSGFPHDHEYESIDMIALFALDEAGWRERFRATPMWRAKRNGMLRNAAIVLGNQGDVRALDALHLALSDPDERVREAAEWAIAQIQLRVGSA